jgi:hypothetical protein
MEDLKKLLNLYPEYPPTPAVWTEIKRIIHPAHEDVALTKTAQKVLNFLKHETHYQQKSRSDLNTLPEPQVIRFYFQKKPYYLDLKNNIYRPEGNTQLSASLCGQINPETREVTIDNQVVTTIPQITAGKTTIHEKPYYLDTQDPKLTTYQAFHPDPSQKLNLIFPIGTMPRKGKLEVFEAEPRANFLKRKSEEEE